MATATIARDRIAEGKAAAGRFGVYGGRYVPETLMAALEELERDYEKAKRDQKFQRRLERTCSTPTPDVPRRCSSPTASPKN